MAGPSADKSVTAGQVWIPLAEAGKKPPSLPCCPASYLCARLVAPASSHPRPLSGWREWPQVRGPQLSPSALPAQGISLQVPQEVLRHEADPLPEPGVLWVLAGTALWRGYSPISPSEL